MIFKVSSAAVFGLGLCLGGMELAAAQNNEAKAEKPEAQAGNTAQQPSDRVVRVIMGYAFAAIPEEVQDAKGKKVKVDRSAPEKFMVSIDDARGLIRQSYLSAKADLCGMKDLERKHFGNIIKYQHRVKKRDSLQLIFVQNLHAATALVMTGQTQAGDDAKKSEDPNKDVRAKYKCSTKERESVKQAVETDIERMASAQ